MFTNVLQFSFYKTSLFQVYIQEYCVCLSAHQPCVSSNKHKTNEDNPHVQTV